jgi:hypothetical protein
MDPYLEEPELWPAVHFDLLGAIRDTLIPLLLPRYYVTIELREYEVSLVELELVGIGDVSITRPKEPSVPVNGAPHAPEAPDSVAGAGAASPAVLLVDVPRPVPVRERYLEIRRLQSHELVTAIEVLSPTNKRPGKGRRQYEEKREAIAASLTNLVEIDLIRAGDPLPVLQRGAFLPREQAGDYRALVLRGGPPRGAALYPIRLRDPLPAIPVPLRPGEAEPSLDLQKIAESAYDRGRYDVVLDYRAEPAPPLAPDDAGWADRLLRERGLR